MAYRNSEDLWRLFRTVSIERRLQLLWVLCCDGEHCVFQLAQRLGMLPPVASAQLKILYIAGLVRYRRRSMNVMYRAEADYRKPGAVELLGALDACCKDDVFIEKVIRSITAFTHERRIEIVRVLQASSCSFAQLQGHTGITSSALSRHLCKLEARKVVRWDGRMYHVEKPRTGLERTLLRLVCVKDDK